MADIHLTKVRFFLEGAETTNNRLQVTLTHTGKETIVDTEMKSFIFTHQPLVALFKYDLTARQYTGPDTINGVIGSVTEKDSYALVGPFTIWKIDISAEDNPGLNLSKVKSAYFEFEGRFRPTEGGL